MRLVDKILRAGRPERPSRFHTGRGTPVPPGRWWHFLRACFSWLRLRARCGVAVRPWLSYAAVRRIERQLPRDAAILEIGAGQSTLWFAPRCASLLSIEADENWVACLRPRVVALGHAHVDLRHIWVADQMVDYSAIPDGSLDFILIDGGPRPAALRNALPKLKPGGALYVDNTDEPSISGSCREDLIAHAERAGGRLEFFPDFAPCTPHAIEGMLWTSPRA